MKKTMMIILTAIVILLLGIKIYLEVTSHVYSKKIDKLIIDNNLPIQIPIEHKTLKQDDYEIHYFISGTGNKETIVFLHPAFSDHRIFDQQIDFFSQEYEVITIDLIGHGLSKRNASKDEIDVSSKHINEILIMENVEKAHIVGISIGSLIAQYFALEYPEKTKSLVVVGGYNINEKDKEVEKTQFTQNLISLFKALFSMNSFKVHISLITAHTETGQALFYESMSYYERKSLLVMKGLQNIIQDRIKKTSLYPISIMVGEFDINLAQKMAKRWHNQEENSEYHLVKDAGHCVNLDQPGIFNKLVIEFIKNTR